ncbi:tape measure protein [Vagococcus fluvialis]|uniref:tape measure protein n=1 Tax=Vagococcus fluvialis TaxID=2738 RepID=UPI0037B3068D
MSDGRIKIDVDIDGKDEIGKTTKNLLGMESGGRKASSSIRDLAAAMGLMKIASAAINVLKSSMDGAINRFDTFNKFPVVMEALGYSTKEVDASMNKLSNGIDGLPTRLDDIVSSAQQLAISTGSLEKGTDTAIALNNAFLASGASAMDAARGAEQYRQMLGKGEADLQSWRTLQETMPIAMDKVSKSFKEQGVNSVNELYDALKDGRISFNDFNNRLIELNEGVGGFAELAKKNSAGIKTSFQNLGSAVVKGLEKIIRKTDEMAKSLTGKNIAENLDGLKGVINTVFDSVVKSMDLLVPVFGMIKQGIDMIMPLIQPLIDSFMSLGDNLGNMFSGDLLGNIINFFSQLGEQLGGFVANILTGLGELILNGLNLLGEYLPKVWEIGQQVFMNFVTGLIEKLPEIVEAGKSFIDKVIEGIVTNVPKLLTAAVETVKKYLTYLLENAPTIISAGIELITHLINGVLNAIPKLASSAMEVIVNFANYIIENLPKIIETGLRIIGELAAGIIKAIPKLMGAQSEVTDSLVKGFMDINWADIGVNIIKGLINGLWSMAGSLWDAAKSIANDVKSTIQGAFDIHSPSRWAKNFIGKNIMIGWEQGLENYAKLPINAIDKAVDMIKLPVLRAESMIGSPVLAGATNVNNTSSSSQTQVTNNYEGFMKGASFVVREEADINKIADQLLRMKRTAEAQRGLRHIGMPML